MMNVMGGIDGIDQHCQIGCAHCWVLALAIAPPRAPLGGGGDRTSRSYGMDKPIWDVLHAPGGAG